MGTKVKQQDYVIFSAELSRLSADENQARTKELIQILESKGVGFKTLVGSYKGSIETSVIAVHSAALEDLAASFEQESILILNPFNDAKLVYLNSEQTVNLGKLIQVSEEVAKSGDSWSFRPDLNQYYAVREAV